MRRSADITLRENLGLAQTSERKTWSWGALRNPNFRWYFIGSILSDFGTWLQNTAQVLLAYRLSHSVLVVGLVTCAQFSSPLVLGPWAGVMTDKFGGRRILLATQLVAAAFAALLAILQFSGRLGVAGLAGGAVASGLAFTFALPARNVTVRRLVPPADIKPAFAMDSVSYNLGRALAPAAGVLLVLKAGFGWAFVANSLSFLVFAAFLVLARQGAAAEPVHRSRVADGYRMARRDGRIAILLLMVAAVTVADDPVLVLGPALANNLHVSPNWSGWFIAALGAGSVLGSVRRSRHVPSLRLTATALAALGLCMLAFVITPGAWFSAAAALGAGITCLIANSATRTLLAKEAGPEREASVMAVWAIAWAGSKPLASLMDGLLASTVGVRGTGVLLALPALVPIAVLLLAPEFGHRLLHSFGGPRFTPRPESAALSRRKPARKIAHDVVNWTDDNKALVTHNQLWKERRTSPRPSPIRALEQRVSRQHARVGGAVVKYHSRPSPQYRYEHYDPKF
jgi:MFS family permease